MGEVLRVKLVKLKSKKMNKETIKEMLIHYYEFDLGRNLIDEKEMNELLELYSRDSKELIQFLKNYIDYLIEINA